MLSQLFTGIVKMALRFQDAVSSWAFSAMEGYGNWLLSRLIKKAVYASFTCIFAAGGAVVGTVVGAMKGQTTETGFLHGAMIGAVSGAITAVQLLESVANGESFSKVAMLGSLVDGKAFMELVSPAVLKAYQWQMMSIETTYREISDMHDVNGVKGMSRNCVRDLPLHKVHSGDTEFVCPICLQDWREGEFVRKLQNCRHMFHMFCIDEWLVRQGTCPICRKHVCNETDAS